MMLWFAMLIGWVHGAALAQPSAQPGSTLPAGVEVKVQAEPRKATVGDPIRIDFDIAHPPEYQVRVAEPEKQLGQFSILAFYPDLKAPFPASTPASTPQANPDQLGGIIHHRAEFIVAVYKPGEFEFPPPAISIVDKSGKEVRIPVSGIKIQIVSVLDEKDQNLRDLKKQAEIPEPARWLLWASLALLALALAGACWGLWRRKKRRLVPVATLPAIDPLDAAEAELRNLTSGGLPDQGLVKQFYVALSEIVRKILEAGVEIPTLERTTAEIMEELSGALKSGEERENLRLVEVMLTDCDLVKFAKYKPSADETRTTVERAFRILRECRAHKARSTRPLPETVQEAH